MVLSRKPDISRVPVSVRKMEEPSTQAVTSVARSAEVRSNMKGTKMAPDYRENTKSDQGNTKLLSNGFVTSFIAIDFTSVSCRRPASL